MVQVTNFHEVETKEGKTFISLELTGGLELVQSSNSGKFYATVRKCRIPSTFDATIAKMMVGQQIPGDIIRIESEPYDYLNKRTGQVITLNHQYAYSPDGSVNNLVGHSQIQEIQMA